MSKRFDNFPKPSFKKPRLDFSVTSVQNTKIYPKPTEGYKPKNVPTDIHTSTKVHVSDIDDILNDDADEFIILASQAVEADLFSQRIINASHLEVSYTTFGNEKVFASTQHPQCSENNDLFTELEDVDLGNLNNVAHLYSNYLGEEELAENFVNTGASTSKSRTIETKTKYPVDKCPIPKPQTRPTQNQEANHKIIATLETVRKNNTKLQSDNSELCDKLITKEGEVATLRYEIKQLKQQNDQMRLEKCQENDSLKKELIQKIHGLEKTVKTQKVELDHKSIEINSKRISSSQHLTNNTENLIHLKQKIENLENAFFSKIVKTIENPPQLKVNSKIFQNDNLKKLIACNLQEMKLIENLKYLQSILSQMQSTNSTGVVRYNSLKLFNLTKNSLIDLLDYTKKLKFNVFTDGNCNPKVEYELLCSQHDLINEKVVEIFDENKWFDSEKKSILRRILAGIAVICKYCKEFCVLLSADNCSMDENENSNFSKSCLYLIFEVLDTISYSYEIYDHMGLITSSSYLLISFAIQFQDDALQYSNLYNFFEKIVFCRPIAHTLVNLSIFLCTIKSHKFMELLCKSNSENNFVVDNTYKIIQFSKDTCVLQVYAAILEVTFPLHVPLNPTQIKMLLQLTHNTIIFFYNAITYEIRWTLKQCRSSRGSSNESSRVCGYNCYNRLVITTVLLIFLSLKHWIDKPKLIDIKQISTIVQNGILLLNDILHINFRKDALAAGGFAHCQRLQMIYDWLQIYKDLFSLHLAHIKTLSTMDIQYIISDTLKPDDNSKPIVPKEELDELWGNIVELIL